MPPLINQLGPEVDKARPDSPSLLENYTRIYNLNQEIERTLQQQDLLKIRLSTADSGAVRNFFLLIVFLVVMVIVIATLFAIAVL